jgi:hypothetical protein
MEVRGVAGQYDHASGREGCDLGGVELVAEADIKNSRHHGVNPVFRVSVRHQFHIGGHFHSDDVGARLTGVADEDGQPDRRRKGRERLLIDVFRQDRSEIGLAWLVRSNHASFLLRRVAAFAAFSLAKRRRWLGQRPAKLLAADCARCRP